MSHPVGGPLRSLAICLRAELSLSKEESFQLARRVLRDIGSRGFVMRKSSANEATEDAEAVEELLEWLTAQARERSEGEHAATAPSLQGEVALAPGVKGDEASAFTAGEEMAPEHGAPEHGAPGASPEPLRIPLADLHAFIDMALDVHDALLEHRPDLAREGLEQLIETLSQHVSEFPAA